LLMPTLTCDPSKHLKSGQYFNPNCFGMPAFGQQGPFEWPYMRTPAYFDSDLALYKNFNITERQKLQFRIQAVNWLNHPLPQFNLAGVSDNQLNFTQIAPYAAGIPGGAMGSAGNECAYLFPTDPAHGIGADGMCHPNVTSISPINTNPTTTGKPAFKTGARTLLFSVKYFF